MLQSQQYAFDGEAAVVTRDANGQIQKAFMLGGTVLTDKSTGIDLLRTKGGSGPIEVQRQGNRVLISGSISGKLYAYAPGANLVVVNGVPEAFSYTGNGIVIGNSNYSGR
jgi:hypothetical protein